MLFGRKRDNEDEDNRPSVKEVPYRLKDARIKDIAPRMDELFPEFRFYFSYYNSECVFLTAYRKGIIFPFHLTMDEACSLWQFVSVVPIAKMLMERWTQYRDNLMAIMKDVGEPHGIWCLMDGLTMDNESGYLVSGMKEDKNAVGWEDKDGSDKEEQCDE